MLHLKSLCRYVQHDICKYRYYTTSKNPFARTWNTLSNEMLNKKTSIYPEHADVVIIGGGFIGSSVGYWLKTRAGSGLSVVILEKDLSYAQVQNNISLGILTHHFTLPENIQLAQYSAEFLRNVKLNLSSDIDIEYKPNGHLILASEKYAERLEQNVIIQKEFGVQNELLTAADIKEQYPWLNTTDVKLGCISTESEGVFNSEALLKGLVLKSSDLGVKYVDAEVIGFNMEQQRDVLMEGVTPGGFRKINKVMYRTKDNEEYEIKFAVCILASGGSSGEVAKFAEIGTGDGLLKIPLPVQQREYHIYNIQDENTKASINTPVIMDTSGLWLQHNALENNFLCGFTPLSNNSGKELLTEKFYEEIIRPSLSNRYPNFQEHQIKKIRTEYQDCNTYDETGILGPHPYHTNLVLAAGFGKLGCQHAPGIGRAIAESIIDGYYSSIDLTRFGFDRMLIDEPLVEFNVY